MFSVNQGEVTKGLQRKRAGTTSWKWKRWAFSSKENNQVLGCGREGTLAEGGGTN